MPGFSAARVLEHAHLQRGTPVFLPRESHGQRSLAGYSPWGCKESDMTEQLSTPIWRMAGGPLTRGK